jgi:hypothetical protein
MPFEMREKYRLKWREKHIGSPEEIPRYPKTFPNLTIQLTGDGPFGYHKHKYHREKSSTFQDNGTFFDYYTEEMTFYGTLVYDDLQLSGMQVKKQMFIAAEGISLEFAYMQIGKPGKVHFKSNSNSRRNSRSCTAGPGVFGCHVSYSKLGSATWRAGVYHLPG